MDFNDCKVLIETTDIGYQDWLEARKSGIGGSDAAGVVGLSPWDSSIRVYLDKVGQAVQIEDNERMRQGRDLEPIVAKRFEEATGIKLEKHPYILQSKSHPFMLANIDYKVCGLNEGFEAKTTDGRNAKEWENGKIPRWYEIQCHHYMAVTGAVRWHIACLILGTGFEYAVIERDQELIDYLQKAEGDFWRDNVLAKVMPSPDGSPSVDAELKNLFPIAEEGVSVSLTDDEDLENYKALVEKKNLKKVMEKQIKTLEQFFKLKIEDAESAYVEGIEKPITWKSFKRKNFDKKKFEEENPELYLKYITQSDYRTFRL
jgi:putative phage-type endonuclease